MGGGKEDWRRDRLKGKDREDKTEILRKTEREEVNHGGEFLRVHGPRDGGGALRGEGEGGEVAVA